MRKTWLVILIFLSMIIPLITPVHAEWQPSVAHIEDNHKTYMLYYDENASRAVSVVETTILFRNEDPNTTTFFVLMPSTVMNDNGTNNPGWSTELVLCYEDGTVFRDMGLITTNESIGFYTLDTKKNYMLKAVVHMPENLTIGANYTSVVKIGALPYNITPETWAAVDVRSFDFTAKIVPTLDYYVFGKVYMSDGSPAEFADVKIKNKNTGGVITTYKTDKNGEYFVKITEIGYHDGDIIMVSAEKGDEKGSASTLVSIVPPFRQDFLGSQCDVHLKKTTENIIEQVKYPLTAGIIIAVCIIGFFSAKKLREKEKEGRAERAKRKLMKLEERRKELEKELKETK
ncbi:MAG: carboxypeptidase-like regulatory domain-containing protein [Thermoplasmatales archaeon]|nr:carboxypeptidase-like regulatory domain-containing protein [Thermoplasmatales archaeon]